MKRKVIAITLTAMMAAGMLAGCGSSDSSSSLAADTTKEASATEADGSTDGDSTAAGGDFSGQISVISREDGSGTRGAFIELFGVEEKNDAGEKVDNTTVDAQITNNTSVMMSTVAGNQYAIGYISLGSLNDEVKALKIDGAEASAENVENGSYKVSRPFNIVTKDGLSADAQDFMDFGYVLGPCVNATGRLDTARHALRLFETGQETEAEEIARDLVDLNQERKELTLQGVEMAKKLCEEGGYENDPVLVLFLPDVHESIAGLIAGRIREMYNRPVFVLTRGEEGVKGSGRSTENYSMYENMCGCAELFTKFGGHPMAAGLSLPEENVEKFRRKINENCPLTVEEVCPDIHIDMDCGFPGSSLGRKIALMCDSEL